MHEITMLEETCDMLNRELERANAKLAKAGDMLHLPLNTERLGKLTENYIVSNREIKLTLNIDRMPIDAKEGLRESIRYLIKEQK